jgi:hypothetical protein
MIATSHALSLAMARSIRLRRPEDALYWYRRLRAETRGPSARATSAIGRAARFDNLSIPLLCTKVTADMEEEFVLLLSLSEKLWSHDTGRKVVKLIAKLQSDRSFEGFTNSELCQRFSSALVRPKQFLELMAVSHEILRRAKHEKHLMANPAAEYAVRSILNNTAGREAEDAGRYLFETALVASARDLEPVFFLCVTWIVGGLFGQDMASSEEGAYDRVDARGKEELPVWAAPFDHRFGSSWDSYYNMVQMVERDGFLSPDREGVFLLAREGEWRPNIKEVQGVYLVQSQSDPWKNYEVNLAILSCTCDAFVRFNTPCKHVGFARERVEETLPFTIS